MVYISDKYVEEISDSYITKKDDTEFVYVETEGGYFEYYIPIVKPPSGVDIENEKIIDVGRKEMLIVEAPNEDNRTEYTGLSSINIPRSVVEEAKKKTGLNLLE